jgi:hypothetical protein
VSFPEKPLYTGRFFDPASYKFREQESKITIGSPVYILLDSSFVKKIWEIFPQLLHQLMIIDEEELWYIRED